MKKRRKKTSRKLSRNGRIFITSFMATICLFGLIWGFIQADTQGRRMSFGDTVPPVSIVEEAEDSTYLRVHALGFEKSLDITGVHQAWEEVKAFFNETEE